MTIRQLLVIIATLLVIAANAAANIIPLNGQNTGEIANRFQGYFQPAGYVFSIWGLIYIGLVIYSIFQALPSQKNNPRLEAAAPWYLLSCGANVAWLFLWHYEQYPLTMIAMATLLVSLIALYLILRRGGEPSRSERYAVRLPFSIYLGWVSVATIANASIVLESIGQADLPPGQETWTVIMLAIALVLGILMAVRQQDAAFPLVLTWAFVGIGIRFPEIPLVSYSAFAAAALALIFAIWALAARPKLQTAV
jgi:hypothetical protein